MWNKLKIDNVAQKKIEIEIFTDNFLPEVSQFILNFLHSHWDGEGLKDFRTNIRHDLWE